MSRKALCSLCIVIGLAFSLSCRPVQEITPETAQLPNPASVYCEEQGGRLEIRRHDSAGEYGACIFPDGSECEEWAFYRQECLPASRLPTPAPTWRPEQESTTARLRVAYAGAGRVMLWDEGGEARALTPARNIEGVRISDDGLVVAYLSQDGNEQAICVADSEGSNRRCVAGPEALRNFGAVDREDGLDFAPASRLIFYTTDSYDLWHLDPAGGEPAQILGAWEGGFFSFSPDGQWMTVYHPDELLLVRPDGSEARVLFSFPPDFRYTMMGPQIVWKPDSSGFFLLSATAAPGEPGNMTVWFIPLAGEPTKEMIYSGPYGGLFSPDGRSLLYQDERAAPLAVHVVSAGGDDIVYGANENVSIMGWAPDSVHFLLNLSADLRLLVPYLCAVDKEPVPLTAGADAHPVVWIDAGRLLYVSQGTALHLLTLGGEDILLDDAASSWFDFAWLR